MARKGASRYSSLFQEEEIVDPEQSLEILPEPLLELILIPGTSTKDKKALRQTCKSFQQVLDHSVTCLRLQACARKNHHHLEKMMMRLQHAYGLKTMKYIGDVKLLPQVFPKLITTFEAHECGESIKELQRLPCLTSLYLTGHDSNPVTGIEHIHGLTRLHVYRPVGSVAHLSLTLKHLCIRHYEDVKDMDQLTNLQVLGVEGDMPTEFFQTHSKLPLRHLMIDPHACPLFLYGSSWASAPATLTHLNLIGQLSLEKYTLPGFLPSSISHLQLGQLCEEQGWDAVPESMDGIAKEVATVLPGLEALDLFFERYFCFRDDTFAQLSNLDSLKSLGVCKEHSDNMLKGVKYELSMVQAVTKAVERGVRVSALSSGEYWGVFADPVVPRTTWAAHACRHPS